MSKSKLEFILQMIDDIEYVIAQHNGVITDALAHRISKPAVLMSLLQIGEIVDFLHNLRLLRRSSSQ